MTGVETPATAPADERAGRDQRVVDTSFIGAIVFGDLALETVDLDWDSRSFIAPSIIRYEFINVCAKKQRAGSIDAGRALDALRVFDSLSITTEYVSFPETLATAMRYRLSGYDAAYLWMALSHGLPLLTLDAQLHKAWQLALKELSR